MSMKHNNKPNNDKEGGILATLDKIDKQFSG